MDTLYFLKCVIEKQDIALFFAINYVIWKEYFEVNYTFCVHIFLSKN